MPTNPKLCCSYCHKSIVSYHLHYHIVHKHPEQLFSHSNNNITNIKRLSPSWYKGDELRLYLPDNKYFHYCFGCDKGTVKKTIAIESHKNCIEKHKTKVAEYYEKYKYILDGTKPLQSNTETPSNTTIDRSEPALPQLEDWTMIQKLIWETMRDACYAKQQADIASRYLESIKEHFEENDTLTKQDWKDFEPMGSKVYLEVPNPKRFQITFDINPETLIHKFEKESNQQTWLDKIDPDFIPYKVDKPKSQEKPLPKPVQPKVESEIKTKVIPEKKPEPVPEQKTEPLVKPKIQPATDDKPLTQEEQIRLLFTEEEQKGLLQALLITSKKPNTTVLPPETYERTMMIKSGIQTRSQPTNTYPHIIYSTIKKKPKQVTVTGQS